MYDNNAADRSSSISSYYVDHGITRRMISTALLVVVDESDGFLTTGISENCKSNKL